MLVFSCPLSFDTLINQFIVRVSFPSIPSYCSLRKECPYDHIEGLFSTVEIMENAASCWSSAHTVEGRQINSLFLPRIQMNMVHIC